MRRLFGRLAADGEERVAAHRRVRRRPRGPWDHRMPDIGDANDRGPPSDAQGRPTANRFARRSKRGRTETAPITDTFAPDMVWRIEGHSPGVEGGTRAKQDFNRSGPPLRSVARFLRQRSHFRPIRIRSVQCPTPITVIVLWGRPRAWRSTGNPTRTRTRGFMKMRDGKVVDGNRILRQHLVQRALDPRTAWAVNGQCRRRRSPRSTPIGRDGGVADELLARRAGGVRRLDYRQLNDIYCSP